MMILSYFYGMFYNIAILGSLIIASKKQLVVFAAEDYTEICQQIEEGTYTFIANFSNKILRVQDGSTADNTKIVQWSDNQSSGSQWELRRLGSHNFYTIVNTNSGLFLDVPVGNRPDGKRDKQLEQRRVPVSNEWCFSNYGSGLYTIVNPATGKFVDVQARSFDEGKQINQDRWVDGINQVWKLRREAGSASDPSTHAPTPPSPTRSPILPPSITPLPPSSPSSPPSTATPAPVLSPANAAEDYNVTCQQIGEGTYTLIANFSNKILRVQDGSTADNTKIVQWSDNQSSGSQWELRRLGSHNFYTIVNTNSGLFLDVPVGNRPDGKRDKQLEQRRVPVSNEWCFSSYGSGLYTIVNQATGKFVDVQARSFDEGKQINQDRWVDGINQVWKLRREAGSASDPSTHAPTPPSPTHSSPILPPSITPLPPSSPTSPSTPTSPTLGPIRAPTPAPVLSPGGEHCEWIDEGTYTIFALYNNKAIRAQDGLTEEGVKIVQHDRGSEGSLWELRHVGSHFYHIVNSNSGLLLDVPDGKWDDELQLEQRWGPAAGKTTDDWCFVGLEDGSYKIENRETGKVADVKSYSMRNDARINQYRWKGSYNQIWGLKKEASSIPVTAPPTPSPNHIASRCIGSTTIEEGTYTIVANFNDKVLRAAQGSMVDGTKVVQWTDNKSSGSRWRIEHIGSSYYHIVNTQSGLLLDVPDGGQGNGERLRQHAAASTKTSDDWCFVDLGGDTYKIVNRASGKVADVPAHSLVEGSDIIQYEWSNGANQAWRLKKTSLLDAIEAVCSDISVCESAEAITADQIGFQSSADASVVLSKFVDPPGPFPVYTTTKVTLTILDIMNVEHTCKATVEVTDCTHTFRAPVQGTQATVEPTPAPSLATPEPTPEPSVLVTQYNEVPVAGVEGNIPTTTDTFTTLEPTPAGSTQQQTSSFAPTPLAVGGHASSSSQPTPQNNNSLLSFQPTLEAYRFTFGPTPASPTQQQTSSFAPTPLAVGGYGSSSSQPTPQNNISLLSFQPTPEASRFSSTPKFVATQMPTPPSPTLEPSPLLLDSCENQVVRFSLIDSIQKKAVSVLSSNPQQSKLSKKYSNIKAFLYTCPRRRIRSVHFTLMGQLGESRPYEFCDNWAPFSLFGDFNGNYMGRVLEIGTNYTITAIPYDGWLCEGGQGISLSQQFTFTP